MVSRGSAKLQANFFLNALCTAGKPNQLAITFDDGPHDFTNHILEVLEKHNVSATFFCIGTHAEKHPEMVQNMIAKGHTVGSHSYSHPVKWGTLSEKKVAEEITKGAETINKISGHKSLLFRPPFGVTNPRIARALNNTNLKVIGWDLRSLDTSIKDPEKLYKRVMRKLPGKNIILFHDSQKQTIEVLDRLLTHCKKVGINIVSLGDLLNISTHE